MNCNVDLAASDSNVDSLQQGSAICVRCLTMRVPLLERPAKLLASSLTAQNITVVHFRTSSTSAEANDDYCAIRFSRAILLILRHLLEIKQSRFVHLHIITHTTLGTLCPDLLRTHLSHGEILPCYSVCSLF